MVTLSPVAEKFILHWGEMGTRWGINRSVAQIHAILYLSQEPLNAEQIATALSLARSNVSTGLRELQSWGLVRTVHLMGDRRDHFETLKDVWEMSRVILEERKRREMDPTVAVLRECVQQAKKERRKGDEHVSSQIARTLEYLQTNLMLYEQFKGLSAKSTMRLAKLGSKVRALIGARG